MNDKDILNLPRAREILKSNLPQSLMTNLDYLVEQRDRVAHGKRFAQEPGKRLDLKQIVTALEDILARHKLNSS
jgi:hypothetical protein